MRISAPDLSVFVLILFLTSSAAAQPTGVTGKLKYTDLTEQEMYLLRFQSICHHISAESNWELYLKEYEEKHPAPALLNGKAGSYGAPKQAEEIGLLMANYSPGQVQLAPLAPHFPLQYLYKFYSGAFLKLAPGGSRQATANEFDIRKNVPEGKRRMVMDAAKLPFGEERYFRGLPMQRSTYDFDNQCFYVNPDFSNVVGFSGMYAGSEAVKIPLTFIEEYRKFLTNLKIPYPEEKAEQLFNKLDGSSQARLWPKVVFTLVDEPVEDPVYVTHNGYNWWTVYPLKFEVKHIDIELIYGFNLSGSELIYRIEDIPGAEWEGWAINSGQLQAEGVKGAISESLSSSKSDNAAPAATGTPTTSGGVSPSETTATYERNFPFMRYYKNRIKEPYVQYAGMAKNTTSSLKPFNQIQLELCFSYYFEPRMHLLRQLRPSLIYGGIYLGIDGEDQHITQALNEVEYLDDYQGYRFILGTNPYGKQLKQAGYKNAYFEVLYNDDHTVDVTLYDKGGKAHFTSKLRPLGKAEKPPFTNN